MRNLKCVCYSFDFVIMGAEFQARNWKSANTRDVKAVLWERENETTESRNSVIFQIFILNGEKIERMTDITACFAMYNLQKKISITMFIFGIVFCKKFPRMLTQKVDGFSGENTFYHFYESITRKIFKNFYYWVKSKVFMPGSKICWA